MMKKILYIGGFAMPNKNAAAQRVLAIAKALREVGFLTEFYGVTRQGDYSGSVDGFSYEAISYPQNTIEWFKYAKGDGIINYIESKSPDFVFTYNYPAVAQEIVIRYCHKHGIKVVGDITEWYMPSGIVKKIDTLTRMRLSNKHLDGIISISKYLNDYYSEQKVLQLPPLVDVEEEKWKQRCREIAPDKIKLIYAGSPSLKKDRLDYIIEGISKQSKDKILLNVVGVTKERYISIFGDNDINDYSNVIFHGILPHNETIKILMESDFQIFFRPNTRVNNAGFPTKYVESVTAGVPVIMNRISNVDDYLIDGVNGIMCESPSQHDIEKILKRVSCMTNKEINRMKDNIDKFIFDYHRYVNSIERFVSEL